jgi:dihydrofolate reductase
VGKVIADQSMSLDGFSAGLNVRIGNGMGDGGEALHEWMFSEGDGAEINASVREETPFNLLQRSGAVVVGRRMFDVGVEPWGENPPFHQPVFVVTHRARDPIVKQGGTTYTFVTDGLDATLARAREAAGGKDVVVLGGAALIQQCLKGGLLDELQLHLVHVLLGGGTRFFGDLDAASAAFERTRVIDGEGVTHIRFRLVK